MKNEDQTKQILQMLVAALPTLMNSEALGRLGESLVTLSKQAGDFILQRLDTDAGYAAGMRELAATAAHRFDSLEQLDKKLDHAYGERDTAVHQISGAIVQLEAILVQAKTLDLSDETRAAAVAALESVLKTLGAQRIDAEFEEPSPAETHRATAKCENDHTWPCVWTTTVTFRTEGPVGHDRIVFPPTCPTCGLKWTEIENEPQAEEQPS